MFYWNNFNLSRDRWVIIRDNTEIFCGLSKQFYFKPLWDIGDTAIKTYSSEKKAKSGFMKSWRWDKWDDEKYRVVKVREVLVATPRGDETISIATSEGNWQQIPLINNQGDNNE